jgi:flavodoxin
MKTLILYYSYTGHTKKIAEDLAKKESADIAEIKEAKRPGRIKAYSAGCFATLLGKGWPIQPLDVDLATYDRLILLSPVWASNPPPFVNTVLKRLPEGKTVSVKMVSASGKSGYKAKIEATLQAKGCTLEGFEDVEA